MGDKQKNTEIEGRFYRIIITETYSKEVEIYAKDSEDAEEIAHELCSADKIDFGPEDFDGRETECRGVSRKADIQSHPCYDRSSINERTKEGTVWS